MVFLTKCPRCKSREVRLEQDLKGLYWRCPKCQHVAEAADSAPNAPAQSHQPR